MGRTRSGSAEDLIGAMEPRLRHFKSRYPAMDPLAQATLLSLVRTQDLVYSKIKNRLAPLGLTPPSFGVLMILESEPGRRMTMGDVSQRCIVTQANVTGLADTLARKGLISRKNDPSDRRKIWLGITPAGRKRLAGYLGGHFDFCKKMMRTLSPSEKRSFIRLAGKIASAAMAASLSVLILVGTPGRARALTLKEAVERTLRSSSAVTIARDDAKIAAAAKQKAESVYDTVVTAEASHSDSIIPRQSIFQPSRNLTDTAEFTLEKGWDAGTKASVGTTWTKTRDDSTFSTLNKRHTTSMSLTVTQPLLKGLIGLPGRKTLEAAELRSRAAWALYARKADEQAARAATAYWAVWKSSRAEQIAYAALENTRIFFASTKKLEKLGLRDSDDVLQAQAAYLRLQAEAIGATTAFEESADALVHLMDGRVSFTATAPLLAAPGLSAKGGHNPQDAYGLALGRRTDIHAARLQVDGLSRERSGLEGAHLPTLDFIGGLSFQGLDRNADRAISNTGTGDFPTWSAGLSLRYPFGGREADAEIKTVSARLAIARTRRDDLSAATALNLRSALRRLKSNSRRYDLLDSAVVAESNAYVISTRKYRQGRVSSRDVLLSQDRLRRARLGALAAEENVSIALIDLKLADGSFLDFLGVSLGR